MKAYIVESWCEPKDLKFQDVPDPIPSQGEVLIEIKAAGVNFPDRLLMEGKYQERPVRPFIPGIEVSGIVIALGEGVKDHKVGDRVMALCWLGGYAEKVAVPEKDVYPMPSSMSFEEGAGFIVTYQSSYFAVVERGHLKPSETLLVHSGAGGIGTSAIQIGKAIGAKIYATVGSEAKVEIAKKAGAEIVLNYHDATWSKKIRKEYGGADVVIDPVGGDVFGKSILCTNFEGRIVVVGFTSGEIPKIATNLLLLNNISLSGLYWNLYQRNFPMRIKSAVEQLNQWFIEGKLKPIVCKTYPLIEAPEALINVTTKKSFGKSILIP